MFLTVTLVCPSVKRRKGAPKSSHSNKSSIDPFFGIKPYSMFLGSLDEIIFKPARKLINWPFDFSSLPWSRSFWSFLIELLLCHLRSLIGWSFFVLLCPTNLLHPLISTLQNYPCIQVSSYLLYLVDFGGDFFLDFLQSRWHDRKSFLMSFICFLFLYQISIAW